MSMTPRASSVTRNGRSPAQRSAAPLSSRIRARWPRRSGRPAPRATAATGARCCPNSAARRRWRFFPARMHRRARKHNQRHQIVLRSGEPRAASTGSNAAVCDIGMRARLGSERKRHHGLAEDHGVFIGERAIRRGNTSDTRRLQCRSWPAARNSRIKIPPIISKITRPRILRTTKWNAIGRRRTRRR